MSKRIRFAILLTGLSGLAVAQPVTDPNGTLVGRIGNTNIELPVRCDGTPVARARSHDRRAAPSVVIGVPTGPSRIGLVDIQTEAHEIYTPVEPDGKSFPMTFAGEADGVAFELVLDCRTAD